MASAILAWSSCVFTGLHLFSVANGLDVLVMRHLNNTIQSYLLNMRYIYNI